MGLMNILRAAQDGLFFANAARATGVYGSSAAAQKALAIRANDGSTHRLAAIAASAVLAALARNYAQPQPQALMGAERVQGEGEEQGGILSSIISAVVKGALQGAARQFAPKRRRRRTISSYFGTRKKRTIRRRRSPTPSLEQIFGEILGSGSR